MALSEQSRPTRINPGHELALQAGPIGVQAPTSHIQCLDIVERQYDPLRVIHPYTTRVKVIGQQLWANHCDWDDPQLPSERQQAWIAWEDELKHLPQVTLSRCYNLPYMDCPDVSQEIHIFSDASEKAYGAVVYLLSEGCQEELSLGFLLARSRVAPRKQQSIPRLELCAALIGAQLGKLLTAELTVKLDRITYCLLDRLHHRPSLAPF